MPLRFAILYHATPVGDHWDWMLETNGVLTTWALPPRTETTNVSESFTLSGKRLPDHRLHYLDYEGPVSNDRGEVRRIDSGTYRTLEKNRFHLFGKRFNGTLEVRTDENDTVTLIFEPFNV